MSLIQAIIIAIIEGITEFLPVSSTGHMVITGTDGDQASPSVSDLSVSEAGAGAIK